MGGNLLSCHGGKRKVTAANTYETYSRPTKPKLGEEPIEYRKKQGDKIKHNGRYGEPRSTPSTPTPRAKEPAVGSNLSNGNTFPRRGATFTSERTIEEDNEDDAIHNSSSLLQLPIENHTETVLRMTGSVIMEMLDIDAVLIDLVDEEMIDQKFLLELMGIRSRRMRCETLMGRLCSTNVDVGKLVNVIRSKSNALADFIDVHHQILTTVSRMKEIRDQETTGEEEEEDVNDKAVMHFETSYWDTETCESMTAEEAKNLKIPLKEAFYTKAKKENNRRSVYETMAINDWNKKLTDNIVPVLNVDLYNQKLGLFGVEIIAKVLEKYSCIRELCIAKNDIDDNGIELVAKALQANNGLAKLDVRLNEFGDAGAEHLSKALRLNKSLRILNVTSTAISGDGVNMLADALAKNTSLNDLDIGFNDLAESNCNDFCRVLKQNIYLKRLRMRHTSITETTYSNIFASLRSNSRIRILDISRNKLGDRGAKVLADMLIGNRSLAHLNVEKCDITNGAEEIARALKANATLKILDISMNEIGDVGACYIAESIKYNRSLESLSMNMCAMGNSGFLALLQALEMNKNMKTLKVCFNLIGVPNTGNEIDVSYKILESIDEKLKSIDITRDDLKILLWGNRLKDFTQTRKNGFATIK